MFNSCIYLFVCIHIYVYAYVYPHTLIIYSWFSLTDQLGSLSRGGHGQDQALLQRYSDFQPAH